MKHDLRVKKLEDALVNLKEEYARKAIAIAEEHLDIHGVDMERKVAFAIITAVELPVSMLMVHAEYNQYNRKK